MPRLPEHDPEETLERALGLFWQRGYRDTSIEDLVECTGVQRYGLYSTFGSKHDLFVRSLESYEKHQVGSMLAELEKPGASWREMQGFFQRLAEATDSPAGRDGCLLCNTAVELGPGDPGTSRVVGRYVERLRRAFLSALEIAQANGVTSGEPGSGDEKPDLEATADHLVGAVVGACVYARTPAPRSAIRSFIELSLRSAGISAGVNPNQRAD